MPSHYSKFLTNCACCGGSTSKKFARDHAGKCKPCFTGVARTDGRAPKGDGYAKYNEHAALMRHLEEKDYHPGEDNY